MIETFESAHLPRRLALRTAIILAFATGLAACGDKPPPQIKPHLVLVVTAHNVSGGYERTFTGVVRARYESDQGFRASGKVAARLVEVGQSVVAGQALARLDPADYELGVRAAEDQLQATRVDAEQAASDEARFQRLLADHSVSIADHERQKARSDAAAARQAQASRQLELARNRMKYATLVAEFDGVITSVRFEVGQVVAEGLPVVTIAKPSELEVVADLPEELAGNARTITASASLWGAPELTLPLKLRELSPAASAQTRTFLARFTILDKSSATRQALHLGITANLHLAAKDGELVAVLPATAVWKCDGKSMVWQIESASSKIVAQPVEVIRYTDEAVLVRGIADGARVVSAGVQKLTPGLEVAPVETYDQRHEPGHAARSSSEGIGALAVKDLNLSKSAVTHQAIVLFMILAVLVAGVFWSTQLGRSEDPNFNVPLLTAVVVWPGATAQEVQDQVMNRMERRLRELNGFDYVKTFSRQGYGAISLRMKGGLPKQQLTDAWYQARKKIGDSRQEFPDGVRGPYFNDEFNDVYMSLYAVQGDEVSMAELLEYAEKIKVDLQSVPTLSKVNILGKQAEKVYVELSTKRLAALGMNPQAVMDALVQQNLMSPSGSVDTRSDRVLARIDGALCNAADVAKISIEAGGRLVRLSDIANVRAGYEDPPSFVIRHNGHPVLVLATTMTPNANILKVGKAVDERMAEIQAGLPAGISVEKYADQPKVVEESVWEFERSFLEALAIVLAVSFFSLGRQAGIVVAASVPLVLGIVLLVMYLAGWNLDRISLGSLIIALGLLVDDAIIAVEMMVLKLEQGWGQLEAATFAYTSTAIPMLTGTMVTVAGFMPVGFARSISGEYAGGIFWVVGVALIASWFVAVIFTPYLGIKLLPASMENGTHADPYDKPIYQRLSKWVDWCVTHRWKVLLATGTLFLLASAGMGLVQQQFFPTASRPELMVELRMREGASFKATQEQVKLFEKVLAQDADAQHFTVYTGSGTPRFYLSMEPELPNPGYAQFVIMTSGIEAREALRVRLLDYFTKDEAQPLVRGRVLRLEFGPPVGFPVQFRVIGPDPDTVRGIAYKVRDIVGRSPLVRDTQLNWNERVRTQRVHIDQDKARLLGLSSAGVSATLQTVLSGAPVTQIRRGEDLIDVVLRAEAGERNTLENLGDINLFSRTGTVVPLSQIARIESTFEEPVLWRWNRNMAITVRSDLVDGVQGPYATDKIWPSLQPVLDSLPRGYRIEKGGAIEEADKSNLALLAIFPAMFLVMLTFLMIQLHSFSRMFMVFMTAPLGLVGVVPALLVFNAPFGFVALLGVIALGGMIMRNSVILVDQIEQDIESGAQPWRAIVDATVRRSRPVVLTAAAAVLAMIPLTRSVFWGPMAIAIMGGLIVATALTLGFVPALYAAWFKVQKH